MSQSTPRISVVMPVHNARPFLNESIGSILAQTFTDIELVILDDASTDGSIEILRQWEKRDPRIRVFASQKNLGLSGSSNFVVWKTRADLIARMDADDISHPDRLQRQWDVMQRERDVVAVGALCDGINAAGKLTRPRDRWRLVRSSHFIPFPHGSAMFRRKTFDAVGGYCEQLSGREDQDIFTKMREHGRVVMLPDVLYRFRYHSWNSSLALGESALKTNFNGNGNGDLAYFYMLNAMHLWAGERPEVLGKMLVQKGLKWNWRTLMAITVASCGKASPGVLRFSLRTLIRARDLLAGLFLKEGVPYEWRFK